MFSQVQQALDCLTAALDSVEATPTGELRRTLRLAKSLRSRVELLETKAASAVAQREGHGDGGAGLLNQLGGRSRSEAARNVRTEAELAELPEARTAVSDGEISLANAAKLAQAARKTSPQAVQGDPELVQMAKALPEDEFAQAAQRWTIRHQSADDLAAQHRRNRRNRNVRFWNGDDGSVQMRGSFDAEMGARIQQRLCQQAELLRQADRRRQTQPTNGTAGGGNTGNMPEGAARTRDQRMADALDTLLASGAAATHSTHAPRRLGDRANAGEPMRAPNTDSAPSAAGGHIDDATEPTLAASTSGAASADVVEVADEPPQMNPQTPHGDAPKTGCACEAGGAHRPEPASSAAQTPSIGGKPAAIDAAQTPSAGRKPAEIIVRADLAAMTGEPGGIAEICGVGPIPSSTLDRLACNSDVWIEIFADTLTPLYETVASRAPTAAQRRALIARDGACIGCGEPPGECEAHHVKPRQRGGKTRLDNLVLVCWRCHDLIHDHNWQVTIRGGRYRLVPPDPAHPAERAPQRKPKRRTPRPPSPPDRPTAERATKPPPTPASDRPLWEDPAA